MTRSTRTEYEPFSSLRVDVDGEVARVTFLNIKKTLERAQELGMVFEPGHELGRALVRLREDDGIRVVVLTGFDRSDGQASYEEARSRATKQAFSTPISVPDSAWTAFLGVRMVYQTLVEMEKPVVARVEGDCVGFWSNIMFACDFIVAREDARVFDPHMGPNSVDIVPGDGGAALVPLFLSPPRAMEYLTIRREYTAAELDRLGLINYAVPADELDATVNDIVNKLLERSAYALAFTKRVVNRRVAEHLNLTLDAGIGYEWVNILHLRAGFSPRTLQDTGGPVTLQEQP